MDQFSREGAAALEVRGMTKAYSKSVTVGPISFTVGEGEFFSLLGPSGCGKSTTLRCIAGFESVTDGEILLSGRRLDKIPAHRRELGLVFQSHALFPHLTIEENVAFGLRLRKMDKAEIGKRVAWAIELVGLSGLEQRAPGQISGGQQQRVALARSLVLHPPLLLLDEPLSSLDLKLRQQMREELRRLQRQLGQTTIFVTHDQTEALSLSDRVAVLADGHIEQIGTPEEIYRKPASEFVARFIGQANLIEARVAKRNKGVLLLETAAGGKLTASEPEGSDFKAGSEVLAVIRPEDVSISADGGANRIGAEIADIEYLGEDTLVRAEAKGFPPLLSSFKTTRAATARIADNKVTFSVEEADVYLLPR